MHVAHKVHYLGLCTARAVYHAVNRWSQLTEYRLYDRRVCARGRQYEFAGVDGCALYGVGEAACAAVYKFLGYGVVVCLGVFFGDGFAEHVVTCRGEAVAAHAAVVFGLVGGLSVAGKTDNHVAGTYVGVVDYIGAAHAACNGAVDNDSAHQVADIGCFASGRVDVYAIAAKLGEQFLGAVDYGGNHFAGHEALVAADCRRE